MRGQNENTKKIKKCKWICLPSFFATIIIYLFEQTDSGISRVYVSILNFSHFIFSRNCFPTKIAANEISVVAILNWMKWKMVFLFSFGLSFVFVFPPKYQQFTFFSLSLSLSIFAYFSMFIFILNQQNPGNLNINK